MKVYILQEFGYGYDFPRVIGVYKYKNTALYDRSRLTDEEYTLESRFKIETFELIIDKVE